MLDSVSNEINNYKRFEECIVKIFEEAEYDTVSNVAVMEDFLEAFMTEWEGER